MRFLVVSSCTGKKADSGCPDAAKLTASDFEDPVRLRRREKELSSWVKPASEMYLGRQHTQMMDGVRKVRSHFGEGSCDLGIISAGYGLIAENRRIAPYDLTFQDMPKPLIKERGERLGIPSALRKMIAEYAVVFFLLGDDYLRSARPPLVPAKGQKFVTFGSPKLRRVAEGDVVIVPAAQEQATQFGDGVVTLKGRMFSLFAAGLQANPKAWAGFSQDRTPETLLHLMQLGSKCR